MAVLTVGSAPARTGVSLINSAVAAGVSGDSFDNSAGNTLFWVHNGSGGDITLTLDFAPAVTVDGVTPANKTFTVVAGKDLLLGPFPAGLYNDTNSRVDVTYSAVTTITVYAFLNQ